MRLILRTPAILLLLLLSACSLFRTVLADEQTNMEDAEEVAEVKQGFNASLLPLDGFIEQSAEGHNLSDMTLGLYVSSLLGQLGGLDRPLSDQLHQGGRFVDGYLTDIFQYHPEEQIAQIRGLKGPGNEMARLCAAAALEALRHIPNKKDSEVEQTLERNALIESLKSIKMTLKAVIAGLP